ncbi:hypothetical protein HDE_02902 [Halotydeus destructor]|nr:hypothetical protein HDE_02902 [Halotydeus destructor]
MLLIVLSLLLSAINLEPTSGHYIVPENQLEEALRNYYRYPQWQPVVNSQETREMAAKRFLGNGWAPGGVNNAKDDAAMCIIATKSNLLIAKEICSRARRAVNA